MCNCSGLTGVNVGSGNTLVITDPFTCADVELCLEAISGYGAGTVLSNVLGTLQWAAPASGSFTVGNWNNLITLTGGSLKFVSGNPIAQYRKEGDCQVKIKGRIASSVTFNATDNYVTTLPVGFRPVDDILIKGLSIRTKQWVALRVQTDGQIFVAGTIIPCDMQEIEINDSFPIT